jgi:hypothetical protein
MPTGKSLDAGLLYLGVMSVTFPAAMMRGKLNVSGGAGGNPVVFQQTSARAP